MAKKSAVKQVKETPERDILEEVIPTKTTQSVITTDLDDDPFASGVSGAITPQRIEPDDELLGGDEIDDLEQAPLEKDKEISEALKKDESISSIDDSPASQELIVELGNATSKIAELTAKLEAAHQEIERLKENTNPLSISDQFDQLHQSLKESRAAELLNSVQKDYFDLKYNSYTDKEKDEIRLALKDALRERFEGKVKAAKLIYKQESKQ